ncbi:MULTISPECIES: hypothetical protein [unclassified Sphingobium]|uniref:hypothetical protein n=1 Tax=unclassified Sphingobium TaxID=2611147 RepID=UPI00222556D0|nr:MULTISPECIES: hypothetical protein [unclassified Sphingobium]MCW2394456.1 hypothetical protein [Sphingobium sp. B8D3B]MCW2417970.1 hypothetical protein [Sphingobium sp. B8D3C]
MRFDIRGNGPFDESEMPIYQFSTLNILWVKIGHTKFEAKPKSTMYPRERLSDFPYKLGDRDEIMLSSFSGHLMVRRNVRSPWLKLSTIVPTLIEAKRFEIGIRDDEEVPLRTISLDVGPLREALKWCDDNLNSDVPYRLKIPASEAGY